MFDFLQMGAAQADDPQGLAPLSKGEAVIKTVDGAPGEMAFLAVIFPQVRLRPEHGHIGGAAEFDPVLGEIAEVFGRVEGDFHRDIYTVC